jgi:LmbE family N-acetylglucosaminyl deacetylase
MLYRRVLALSPHPDDAELGAGGTIARLLEEGSAVDYVVFSGCEKSVPAGMPKDTLRIECVNSLKVLGVGASSIKLLDYEVRTFPEHRQEILEDLILMNKDYRPDLVLVPSSHDMHQDHTTIYWEALRAFKKQGSIWGYEHPWNNLTFSTDLFVKLKPEHLAKKIACLKMYDSQADRSYMSEKNLKALVHSRGSQLDIPCAEAFELVRLLY